MYILLRSLNSLLLLVVISLSSVQAMDLDPYYANMTPTSEEFLDCVNNDRNARLRGEILEKNWRLAAKGSRILQTKLNAHFQRLAVWFDMQGYENPSMAILEEAAERLLAESVRDYPEMRGSQKKLLYCLRSAIRSAFGTAEQCHEEARRLASRRRSSSSSSSCYSPPYTMSQSSSPVSFDGKQAEYGKSPKKKKKKKKKKPKTAVQEETVGQVVAQLAALELADSMNVQADEDEGHCSEDSDEAEKEEEVVEWQILDGQQHRNFGGLHMMYCGSCLCMWDQLKPGVLPPEKMLNLWHGINQVQIAEDVRSAKKEGRWRTLFDKTRK